MLRRGVSAGGVHRVVCIVWVGVSRIAVSVSLWRAAGAGARALLLLCQCTDKYSLYLCLSIHAFVLSLSLSLCGQAVRVGDLEAFHKAMQEHAETFKADKTYSLIVRLRHNVIKTGSLRRYSRREQWSKGAREQGSGEGPRCML